MQNFSLKRKQFNKYSSQLTSFIVNQIESDKITRIRSLRPKSITLYDGTATRTNNR